MTCAPQDVQIIFSLMLIIFFWSRNDDSQTDHNSSDSQFGASYYSVTNLCCVTSSCEVHSADCIILLWSRLSLEECLLFQTVNLPVRMGLTAAGRGGGGGG